MQQTRLLARAFFSRLFESDLMPDGLPQVQLVIWGMLLAATPTTAYAMMLPKKYQYAQFFIPLGPEFDADRLSLITLSMIVIGVRSIGCGNIACKACIAGSPPGPRAVASRTCC